MRRSLSALASLAALALAAGALAGCNADLGPYAAKVGSSTISQATLDSTMSSIQADHAYSCLVSGGRGVQGSGTGTYSATFAGFVLTNLIRAEVVHLAVERRHLAEPSSVTKVATSQLQQSIANALQNAPSCGSEATAWQDLAAGYRNVLVRYQVDEDALAAAAAGTTLSPGDLARFAARHPALGQAACVSVIEVHTAKQAETIARAIHRGASFASEAKAHSNDAQSAAQGGSIGCVPASQLIAPLNGVVARLPVGQLSAPVDFTAGGAFLLLEVTAHQPLAPSTLIGEIFSSPTSGFAGLLAKTISATGITVDPRYGSWSVKSSSFGQVTPPKGPSPKDVLNPGAVVATPTTQAASGLAPAG